MTRCQSLSRKELYDLVWSMPMRDLAKQFDLSDQGLAKKCKKHNIPRPPQGYWLKNEEDRGGLVKPLPANDDPLLEDVDFFPRTESLKQSLKAKSTLIDEQLTAALEFQIPEWVNRYHPLIKKCRDAHKANKKPRLDKYSRIFFGRDVLNPGLKVTPETFDRACLFLQGLINLFSTYGWKLKEDSHKAYFEFDGNELEFEIKERVTKKKEPDTKSRSPLLRGAPDFRWTIQEYQSTGKLEFEITNVFSSGFKKHWYDSDTNRLEDQIVSIVQGFSRAFDAKKIWRIEWEESRRQQEIEKAERKEKARLLKIEEDRRKHLFSLGEDFHKAKAVRDFLHSLEGAEGKPDGLAEWLSWAHAVIDEIDPLCHIDDILDRHEKFAEPPKNWWD